MRTLISTLVLTLLIASSSNAAVKHDVFDEILQRYTMDGEVRYSAIRDKAKFDLYAYLDNLANTDVSLLSRDEQLAYYINLYNATCIAGIIERLRPDFAPAEKEHELFKAPLVNLSGGRKMSLNDLANKVIRPTFKDPRVNAALVYGAKGNVPLRGKAYRAEGLNEALDERMKRWINDSDRNKIDRSNKKLTLSKLFEWFADDFGGRSALPAYISKYADGGSVDGFAVEFEENFDWSLNGR